MTILTGEIFPIGRNILRIKKEMLNMQNGQISSEWGSQSGDQCKRCSFIWIYSFQMTMIERPSQWMPLLFVCWHRTQEASSLLIFAPLCCSTVVILLRYCSTVNAHNCTYCTRCVWNVMWCIVWCTQCGNALSCGWARGLQAACGSSATQPSWKRPKLVISFSEKIRRPWRKK